MADGLKIEGRAKLSPCEKYRYLLERIWNPNLPTLGVIMLNPSTADDKIDDPTIRKCIAIAKKWNFGAIKVANLFALVSTKPKNLKAESDPIGPENDSFLRKVASECSTILCGWGDNGHDYPYRLKIFMNIFTKNKIVCLNVTKKGMPHHPLYIKIPDDPLNYGL